MHDASSLFKQIVQSNMRLILEDNMSLIDFKRFFQKIFCV